MQRKFALVGAVAPLLCLTFAACAFAQTGTRSVPLTTIDVRARNQLRELVQTHPRFEVRSGLNEWIITGKVFLATQADRLPPEMEVALVMTEGRRIPTLVVNPVFITGISNFDRRKDLLYKQLVLWHEFQHLANHFSGAVPLRPDSLQPGESVSDRARYVWQSEHRATRQEWLLAKEWHAEELLPAIAQWVTLLGEEKGFLRGFFELMKATAPVITSEPQVFIPLWQGIYEKEMQALPRP